MDVVFDRLQTLETRVRDALGELGAARTVRESLEDRIKTLEAELRAGEQVLSALRSEREREAAEVAQLRAERDEIRARLEGLLEEIGRLEGALQGTGGGGSA
ncbi:MAG: hypothetical protein WC713_11890 [Candidatus Methylomirabilota bacterium]